MGGGTKPRLVAGAWWLAWCRTQAASGLAASHCQAVRPTHFYHLTPFTITFSMATIKYVTAANVNASSRI